MADLESVYLPALEPCLVGRTVLLSWEDAYLTLHSDVTRLRAKQREHSTLVALQDFEWNQDLLSFLKDASVKLLLSKPLNGFSAPTKESHSQFETRTSAINITDPGADGPYNVARLKSDALWLSKESKIDELSALRLVILEWQSHDSYWLRCGVSDAKEDTSSGSGLRTTFRQSTFSQSAQKLRSFATKSNEEGKDETTRRRSLLKLSAKERLAFLNLATLLLQVHCEHASAVGETSYVGALDIARTLVESLCGSDLCGPQRDLPLVHVVDALRQRTRNLEAGSGWSLAQGSDPDLEVVWAQTQIDEIVALLKIFYTVLTKINTNSQTILSFINLILSTGLLELHLPQVSSSSQDLLKILSASVTTLFFPLSESSKALLAPATKNNSTPLWTNADAMKEINSLMLEIASKYADLASIPIYSWALYVQQSKTYQVPQSPSDIQSTYADPANLQLLANAAVNDMHLFDNISRLAASLPELLDNCGDTILQDSIRMSQLEMLAYSIINSLVVYEPEVVGAVLSLMDADRSYWKPDDSRTLRSASTEYIAINFLEPWLQLARSRFPLEAVPLLRLVKALLFSGHSASAAYQIFARIFNSTITGFTEQLNPDFAAYDEADVDPSKGYFIELQAELPLFISRLQANHEHGRKDDRALVLASQSSWHPLSVMHSKTMGEVLGDQTRPLIVDWNWNYNPLDYILDWLASAAPGSRHVLFSSLAIPTDDECADIISLCNGILDTLKHADQQELNVESVVESLLNTTSRGFDDDTDLISAVFGIFEYQIQLHRQQSGQPAAGELLTQCIQFVHAVSYFRPGRVWSYLAQSQLLDLNGNDSGLIAIVTNSEMVQARYDFLDSSVRLFERLVDIAVVHAATKPTARSTSNALTRFAHEASGRRTQYVPTKTIKNIISGYLRIMTSVFANSQFWPFESRSQKALINIALIQSFRTILHAAYGFAQSESPKSQDNDTLIDAARTLVDLLLNAKSSEGLVDPILSIVKAPLPLQAKHLEKEKIVALELCTSTLRVALYIRHDDSKLEQTLFAAAPRLAQVYTQTPSLRSAVTELLDALLIASSRHDGQPPSLLGYMGADVAKSFLTLLTRQNAPCLTEQQKVETWNFLTTIISSQQQWFALYLLTGHTPRESTMSKNKIGRAYSSQSIIQYALDALSQTFSVVPSASDPGLKIAVSMIGFVAQSCNHWPSAVAMMRQHPTFIPVMAEYFSKLGRFDVTVGSMTWHTALGAGIAEVLSIHLHAARQAGDIKPALDLINKLGYLKNFAFKPPQYNHAVQSLLKRNVSSLFESLNISQFQHSLAFPVEHGRNYFYDVPTAMAMLQTAKGASGRQSGSQSFLKDFEHANLDLSKIDIQLQLNQKSRLLVVELSNALAKDTKLLLVDPLLDVLSDVLMHMNVDSSLPSGISNGLSASQVGLAMTLLQRLVAVKSSAKVQELVDLFPAIWTSVSRMLTDMSTGLTSEQTDVRRNLLQILFLSIQPLTRWRGKEPDLKASARATVVNRLASSTYTQLLEITSEIIAKGFKALSGAVHEDSTSCTPSDFALLTAMLQTILTVPGVETIHSAMVLQLQNAEVSRYATSLFSWADQLLINGDPIYGEHSMLFLLELSTIPSMAEILAVDGVLAQLSAANLMTLYSRPQGASPFTNPPRAHSIWARGILPLCLNLLSAVGAPIAAEIVSFLLQSSPQISRVGRELGNANSPVGTAPGDTHLTLSTAAELHTLALLTAGIDTLRVAGGADIPPQLPLDVWDPKAIVDDIDEWLAARTTRRDWIVPVSERDAELLRLRPLDHNDDAAAASASPKSESRLEQRVWAELQGAKDCLTLGNGSSVDAA